MAYERKNTTPDIEELIGQTDTRTRQERQSDALREWLAKPNWSPDEARLLLVGLDPEQSFSEREGRWWLPSTLASEQQLDLEREFDDGEFQDRLRRVGGLGLRTAPPEEIVKAATKAKIFIPWLRVAAHDKKCKLPPSVRKAAIRSEQAKAAKQTNIDSRNEATRARLLASRAPTVAAAQKVIDDMKANGLLWKNGKKVSFSAAIREIRQQNPKLGYSDDAIRTWKKTGELKF